MRNNLKTVLILTGAYAAFIAAPVHAESASDSLTRIEAETLVLKAREKQLDVQASIIAKQNDIVSKQQLHDRLTQDAVAGNPVIRSIEGLGKRMFASLQLSDGSVVDVQVGETLSNGMRVVSIRPNEVIVEGHGKRRTRLATAAHVTTSFNPSYPSPGLNIVPPLPVFLPKTSAR